MSRLESSVTTVTELVVAYGYAHSPFESSDDSPLIEERKDRSEWVINIVNRLIVYGSENCIGWKDVQALLGELRSREPEYVIEVRDPADHREEFREKGLVVCPSFLFGGELIAVGVPRVQTLREKIDERRKHKT